MRLLELSAGVIKLVRPDGSIVLDASARMPHVLGSLSVTGAVIDWPVLTGELNVYLPLQNKWRHFVPAHNRMISVTLATYVSPALPQFFWSRVRLSQSVQGYTGYEPITRRVSTGEWQPWFGSILVEGQTARCMRHMNLAVNGGSLVAELWQAGFESQYEDTITHSTQSTYAMDLETSWGVFDA